MKSLNPSVRGTYSLIADETLRNICEELVLILLFVELTL